MNWLCGMRALLVAGVVVTFWPSTSKALEPIDFSLGSSASETAEVAKTAASDDDEDAFFSGATNRHDMTGSIATIGAVPRAAVRPRPTVDVVATCRAVLADNLNHYNHNFIEGCQRSVRQGSLR